MTDFERREADWLTLDEALERVLAAARPLPEEDVDLEGALGRALSRPVAARATLPPWDNSAMDGYAVRSEDVAGASEGAPVELEVVGEVRAGEPPQTPVRTGQAVRIMTGGPVPPGADSVVRVEDTDREEAPGRVRIRDDRDREGNVRPGGQDMTAGEDVLLPGTTVTPGVVAVLAALGHPRVRVRRRPRIAILSSGDELRSMDDFEEVVEGRGIPETNGPALAAAVRAAGGEAVPLGVALDDADSIRERVQAAAGADLLVTTGGASMGEADLFKRVLEGLGLEVDFWRARIRPGSPVSLGFLPGRERALPVLGLPGNPASAFVTFQLLVRPFVLAQAGHRRIHRPVLRAVAGEAFHSKASLTHFHRVVLDEDEGDEGAGRGRVPVARSAWHQSSGLVRSLGLAQGLAVVPQGVASVAAGETVEVILLDDGPGSRETPGYTGSRAEPKVGSGG